MAQGERAAQGLGDKIKGAANLAHGSGEVLRANVNNFVDNLGDQATSHSGSSGTHEGVGDGTTVNPGLHSSSQQHSTLSNPQAGSGGVGHAAGQGGASRDVQNKVENQGVANRGTEEVQAGLAAFQKK